MNQMKEVLNELLKFRKERSWEQFHTPENLSKSIIIEASELLENFQWGPEIKDLSNIKDEVADIFSYLLLLCNDLEINLLEETKRKILKNAEKYPVEKSYGISKKYNEL